MSATNTSTPAVPASAIDLAAGKDLTSLDDNALLSELGFDPVPEGTAAAEPTSAELEEEVINSVVAKPAPNAAADDTATEDEPAADADAPPAADAKPNEQPAAEKQLAAQFNVFDAESELEIPDLFVSFKADGGKEFEKVPLDKLVRIAQQGVYNHRLQTEVQEAREVQQRLSQRDQELADAKAAHQHTINLAERLLTDEAYFDQALANYQAYNSPEAIIERQKAEIDALRTARTQPHATSEGDQVTAFFTTKAGPAMESIATHFSTVTPQELLGQFMLLTAPLQVNGKVPPARFADVERILSNELAPWAQSLHEERAAVVAERAKQAKAAEKAKQAAANSKRQLARVIRPAGRPAPDVARRAPAVTADDAADQIIAEIIAGA